MDSPPLSALAAKARKEELYKELLVLVSAKRRTVCEKDFKIFIRSYLAHLMPAVSPAFHYEMMALMQTIDVNRRLLFIAPRGFAKSTLCSVFFPLWLALFAKKKDIFLVSATIALARELLRKIRTELESNEYILYDFGDLRLAKWTEEQLELKNGVVIRAKGRGFQIRGFRPDMIICDDLEDEEVIYSKEQRDKMETWFFRTLLPALKPDQNLVYVGTMLHQFSLINKLKEKKEFLVKFYKALVTDPVTGEQSSIWEELWSLVRLKALRAEIGTYAFEAEYQNNPISVESQPIKPEMIKDVLVKGQPELKILSVDPAISEKTSADFSALTVFSRNADAEGVSTGFKEIHSERIRLGPLELVTKILDLYKIHKPNWVVIEEVAFQKVLKPVLIKEARKEGLFIPVTEAHLGTGEGKRPRDKYTRLLAVVHLFEQRIVELHNPELIEEALSFPHGEHDDMVDAMVYALQFLTSSRTGSVVRPSAKRVLPFPVKESFYIKEVRPGVWEAKMDSAGPPPPKRRGLIILR